LERVHHDRRGAHVRRGKALSRGIRVVGQVARADIDGDDRVRVLRGDRHRQVVDRAAVDALSPIHAAGREESRERA
jgi:hypothetical protein